MVDARTVQMYRTMPSFVRGVGADQSYVWLESRCVMVHLSIVDLVVARCDEGMLSRKPLTVWKNNKVASSPCDGCFRHSVASRGRRRIYYIRSHLMLTFS